MQDMKEKFNEDTEFPKKINSNSGNEKLKSQKTKQNYS
jgi:hypothetical protein